MKTIVEKESGLSKYLFDDSAEVVILENKIQAPGLVICDLNSANAELVENVDQPSDWEGNKYKLIDRQWIKDNGLGGLTFLEAQSRLSEELAGLRQEIALLIMQIRLIHDPEPQSLTQMTPGIRDLYVFAKDEIAALTGENYKSYILRGAQAEQLIDTLKTFL